MDEPALLYNCSPHFSPPVSVGRAIEGISQIQLQIEELRTDSAKKIAAIRSQFDPIFKVVYRERRQFINAHYPNFWRSVVGQFSFQFMSHPATSKYITNEDGEVLKHLKSFSLIQVSSFQTAVVMGFHPNSHFTNTRLRRDFKRSGRKAVKSTPCEIIQWEAPHPGRSFFDFFSDIDRTFVFDVYFALKLQIWPHPERFAFEWFIYCCSVQCVLFVSGWATAPNLSFTLDSPWGHPLLTSSNHPVAVILVFQ